MARKIPLATLLKQRYIFTIKLRYSNCFLNGSAKSRSKREQGLGDDVVVHGVMMCGF
jgi:hypothetical protein